MVEWRQLVFEIVSNTLHKNYMRIIITLVWTILFSLLLITANAVECFPNSWEANRTVEGDCDFPIGYKVSGDMYTGPYTVNVTNGTLWINLSTNKITFTTGKILFTNGKADNSVSAVYSRGVGFANGGYYPCPGGRPVHTSWTRLLLAWWEWNPYSVWGWTFYCWK